MMPENSRPTYGNNGLIRSVGIFCASSSKVSKKYVDSAVQVARTVVDAGWTIVYGGGGTGLMGTVATAALNAGGRVVGIRPTFISDFEGDQLGLTEMIITKTMHERIALLFERSDAFIVLPGSCGTLDEVVQAITWKRLGLHNKAIAILNQDGYFDHLLAMFDRTVDEHFVDPAFRGLYEQLKSPDSIVDYLRSYEPPARMVV